MQYWLEQHPFLILIGIATISFAESFALIGIVIPGVVILFSLAVLASNGEIPLFPVLLAAALGACGGDISSFAIGRWLQHRVDHLAWFQRHRNWLEQGEWFFRRWGWLSVIIGRFVGPIRPVIPLVAGTLNMPARLFIGLNLVSVLAWAPVYILPGYMAGEFAILLQERSLAERTLAITILTGGCLLLAGLAIYHHLHLEHGGTRRWLPLFNRIPPRFPFSSLALLLASGSALIGLILARPLAWDHLLSEQVPVWRSTGADYAFLGITLLGDPAILTLTGLIITFWLLLKGHFWLTLHLIVLIPLALGGIWELKAAFGVARPEWVANLPAGEAFPSGHAAGFALYVGMLSAIANEARPAMRRWQLYLPAGVAIMLMALSRVWLGVHWLSDVLAGVFIALVFSALVRISYVNIARTRFKLAHTGPFWLLLLLTFLAYLVLAWPQAQLDYQFTPRA